MRTELLIKDPVFQLNLLIWMSKEQPISGYRVNPLFFNLGFEIFHIEKPFPFPEETVKLIKKSKLDISSSPEPDLTLRRMTDLKALYFEAKANSFGAKSTDSKQAYAHLIANGPVFNEVLAPMKTSLLCYVVPQDGQKLMTECLTKHTEKLKNKGLEPGLFSSHGLTIKESNLIYSWDKSFENYTGVKEDSAYVLDNLEEDTDPTPLILVFSEDDCSNHERLDFYRQVVIEKIRALLLCELKSHPTSLKYEVTPDYLFKIISDDIFQYQERKQQKRLRQLVFENIFKKINENWKDKQHGIELDKYSLSIIWTTDKEKEDFLDWFEDRLTIFSSKKPPDENLPLFKDQEVSNGEIESETKKK